MTVTTGTITSTKQITVGYQKYLVFINMAGTGDASGGGFNISQVLTSYIPSGSRVTVLDVSSQYSHQGDGAGMHVPATSYERAIYTPLLAYNSSKEHSLWGSGAVEYALGRDSCPVLLPCYLGQVGIYGIIYFTACVNTNAASYTWQLTLLCDNS